MGFFLPLKYIWQVCPLPYRAFHGHNFMAFSVTPEAATSVLYCAAQLGVLSKIQHEFQNQLSCSSSIMPGISLAWVLALQAEQE